MVIHDGPVTDICQVNTPEDLAERLKVRLPLGEVGGLEITRFRFGPEVDWPRPGPRPAAGLYTGLRKVEDPGRWWMSDMPNEVLEQLDFIQEMNRAPRDSALLIIGLGLGVVLRAALMLNHKGPIDVVEQDWRLLALLREHYEAEADMYGAEVRFHQADAYEWDGAGPWRAGYADIWRDIVETNLDGIERLRARYGPRCGWFGAWSEREARWLKGEREAGHLIPGVPTQLRRT